MPKVELEQQEIEVGGQKLTVTYIPTATSGCWYTVHDAFEIWGAVAIDLSGRVVGWRHPPRKELRKPIEEAIKRVFHIEGENNVGNTEYVNENTFRELEES